MVSAERWLIYLRLRAMNSPHASKLAWLKGSASVKRRSRCRRRSRDYRDIREDLAESGTPKHRLSEFLSVGHKSVQIRIDARIPPRKNNMLVGVREKQGHRRYSISLIQDSL